MSTQHLSCPHCGIRKAGTAESLDEIHIECRGCGACGPKVLMNGFKDNIEGARDEAWRLWDNRSYVEVPVVNPNNPPEWLLNS